MYIRERGLDFPIPPAGNRVNYSPRSFTGTCHLLRARLARPEAAQMLARAGYPAGMEAMLRTLSLRLSGEEFPHEIGLFLGYPPEDVEG